MSENQDKKASDTPGKISEAEQKLIDRYRDRKDSRHDAPRLKVEHKPDKSVNITIAAGGDSGVHHVAMLAAFGTTSLDFLDRTVHELLGAGCRSVLEEKDVNGVLAAMHGIAPRDEIEAMLAAQMIATHTAAMRCLRQLKGSDTVPQQDSNGNIAIKLLRTYTAQLEALQRYRGKGQQKMTVEHVHVHAGGKAIVGNVNQPEGGGVATKTEEQPHAKQLTYAPGQPMPSPDTERQPVPVTCNAER